MKRRIGRGVASNFKWEFKDVAGKRILRVDSLPSPTPVFLKHEGVEEIYIRNGPASVQLPPSKVMEYTKKHIS